MKKAQACFADGGAISKADQMIAEMNRKYGVSGNSQPAPPPVQQPAPQPAPQQSRGLIGDAINIIGNRAKQIDKAASYANGGRPGGGKIQGPGTPTSDSIPATVKETGEGIAVSTTERIVSHDQDAVLEAIARRDGYKSLDAMFEELTGKPVGPTIKGGKKAAAGGWNIDNNPDEYAKAMQEQVLGRTAQVNAPSFSVGAGKAPLVDGIRPWYAGASSADNQTGLEMERVRRAGALSAGAIGDPVKSALQFGVIGGESAQPAMVKTSATTGSSVSGLPQSSYSNEGRSVPSAVAKPGAGIVVDNEFTQGGKSYTANPSSQQGISRVTAPGTSPLYTNIDPQKAVAGLKDQTIGQPADQEAQGIARIANANKIRGEMIANRDKDLPAGGYAPSILGDGGIEASNAEKTQRWRNDEMLRMAKNGNQAAVSSLLNADGQRDVAAMGNETSRQNAGLAAQVANNRDQVTMRGQDLNAQNEAQRIAGNPLDNQTKQLSLTQAQRISDLQAKAIGGDKNALASIQALTGKNPNADRYITVQGGEEIAPDGMSKIRRPSYVFDQQTGQRVQEGGQQAAQAPEFKSKDELQAAIKAGTIKSGQTVMTPNGPMVVK